MKPRLNLLIVIGVVIVLILAFRALQQFREGENETFTFEHPALENPEVAGKQVVRRIELLEPRKAFDFTLTDMDNGVTQLSDFDGKLVLIGFIYTSCPDVCGLLTQHFRHIQREFNDIVEKDLVLIFITTDPRRDTPERIKAYTRGFGGKWRFLTGSESELQEVWDAYRVFVKEKRSVDLVYHSYMVTLIDRNENVRYRYIGLVDPQEVIVKDIKHLLQEGGV
ncbi:MAG: SCO family protein [Fidelibacterota bacterium]